MAGKNGMPMLLSLQSLEEMTNGFSDDRVLGCGAYGKVYRADYKDGRKFAVKILHDMQGCGDGQFDKEFYNLLSLQHQNIVQLVGYCHETRRELWPHNERMVLAEVTKKALCFEFMKNGSLSNYLFDVSDGHGWRMRYTIIKGICTGLKYLHEELNPPIFHLDLKPANILLDENMIAKIADFGLSRLFGAEKSQITNSSIGTWGYLPPEYIDHNIISNKLDIFSLGVVILKIIAGPTGYTRSAEMSSEQFIEIVHGNWRNRLQATSADLLELYSEQAKRCIEIALSCVEADRGKRPTIGDIVNMLSETETLDNDQGASIDQVNGNPRNTLQAISGDASESYFVEPNRSLQVASGCLEGARQKGQTMGDIASMLNETEMLKNDQWLLIDQMSSCMVKETALIDVHPLQLHFPFRPYKSMSCPVRVTNNMDDRHVAVRIVPKFPVGESYYTYLLRKLHGVVPPRTTYTFVVTMRERMQPPKNLGELALVVDSCLLHEGIKKLDDSVFTRAKDENKGEFHEITVSFICAPTMTSEQAIRRPAVQVLPNERGIFCTSIDVHPTEPWVLLGYDFGSVCIWNYETESTVKNLKIDITEGLSARVPSVRFIALKQWFVAGDNHGYIHVYTYITMKKLKEFKAHSDWVTSLSVHPTQPLMLSASQDGQIKLWDCDAWVCVQSFDGHSGFVCDAKFNPHDDNTFATASSNSTVKIWSILSPKPVTTLECQQQRQLCVDYYPKGGGQQHYLVTGSDDGPARIWDLQTETCVRQIMGLQTQSSGCNVCVINCLRDDPTLVIALEDHSVSLYDSTTCRKQSTVQFGLGAVSCFAYIKRIRSLAIPHVHGIAIMEID